MCPPFVVSCVPCSSYDREAVEVAVREALRLCGSFPPLVAPVIIKANLLAPSDPSRAVTTHPEILRALSMELIMAGCPDVMIGDNPGYIFRHQETELFRKTGVEEICREIPARFGLLSRGGFAEVRPPKPGKLETIRFSADLLKAPCVIGVSKLKTHVETEITGAIKNMFGAADTDTRKRAHGARSRNFLPEAIVDIFSVRVPDMFVLDAVEGMEGYGPSHGRARKVGWVAASPNGLALDHVQAVIMGFSDPLSIPLLSVASGRIDGPRKRDDIELRGASWEELPCRGFKRAPSAVRMIPPFLRGAAHQLVSLKPVLEIGACIRCGICMEVCPVEAIEIPSAGWPLIDRNRCVQCLCCHEMCPTGAMGARESLLSRLLR
ncbi:MAG: hypothetical protein XE01_0102 [Synergistales bacterium 58_81]|nr:MAG: hypothetical protein XD83_0010 [Synergistales bacterium 57_84]KUK89033.1 MAG: hypothetical protein XE01_0102 [Synergistales bacterium 58_81]